MNSAHFAKAARRLAALLAVTLAPVCSAQASDDHYWVSHDPSIGYAVAIQRVYQFPAAFVYQPAEPVGYPMPAGYYALGWTQWGYRPGTRPYIGGSLFAVYDQYAGPSFIPR
jgi:hypothetical protein